MSMAYTVLLGGTFSPIHDGHRALFKRAFELGRPLVGLTSDSLADGTRDSERHVESFENRKSSLEDELETFQNMYGKEYKVESIDDPFKMAVEYEPARYLVVSPEDKVIKRANDINRKRTENNIPELSIKIADPIYAEDGERISSTRIVNGEIDEHGNLLK